MNKAFSSARWDRWSPEHQQIIAGAEIEITTLVQAWVDTNSDVDPKLFSMDAGIKLGVDTALGNAMFLIGPRCPVLQAYIRVRPDRKSDRCDVLVAVAPSGA